MSEVNVRTTSEYLGLRAKLTQLKIEHAALQGENERLKAEAASARSEVETAKSKYDDNKLKAENQELKTKLRTTEHRKVFDRLAKDLGAPEDALDVIWRESGYQAAKDEVDETAVAAAIAATKGKPGLSRLFGEAQAQPETSTSTPGPGRGQGAKESKPNGKFVVTRAQMADPLWCAENHQARSEHMKAGTLEVVD